MNKFETRESKKNTNPLSYDGPPISFANAKVENDFYEIMRKAEAEKQRREQEEKKAEMTKEEKNKLETKKVLKSLRKKDFGYVFANGQSIEENLKKKGYFEKMIAFEQGIQKSLIDFDQIIEIMKNSTDNGIRMAIIDSLSSYKETKMAKRAMKELMEYYFKFKVEDSQGFGCKRNIECSWIIKNETDYEFALSYEEDDYMHGAIIESLAKFGSQAEKYLFEIFSKNRKIETRKNEEYEKFLDQEIERGNKNIKIIEKSDEQVQEENAEEPGFDRAGYIADWEYKNNADDKYFYNKRILSHLSKINTGKLSDKFIELIARDFVIIFVYRDEVHDILSRIDKNKLFNSMIRKLSIIKKMIRYGLRDISFALSDAIGNEVFRDKLNEAIDKKTGNTEILVKIRSIITESHKKSAIENLQRFYKEKIKFEEYILNREMNVGEVMLLQGLIGKNEKVIEEGCGTGRLLLEMKKAGYDMTGFDFASHIKKIKEADPEVKVFEGNWHQTGIKEESFDTAYSLGRNILHDYQKEDQIKTFKETNRILKKNGRFIFDVPNIEKATEDVFENIIVELRRCRKDLRKEIENKMLSEFNGYEQMVLKYGIEMYFRGVQNFRFGSIYDSPDGINFATRYVYSEEDIRELAALTGFKIKDIIRKELKTGQGDENVYYVLEKTD